MLGVVVLVLPRGACGPIKVSTHAKLFFPTTTTGEARESFSAVQYPLFDRLHGPIQPREASTAVVVDVFRDPLLRLKESGKEVERGREHMKLVHRAQQARLLVATQSSCRQTGAINRSYRTAQ